MGDIIVILHEECESVKVLRECIELQNKKSKDYQNPNSNVKQAMHYRRGVDSIHDIMQGKMYRAQSILESNNYNSENFESLEDTYKDLINYASFAVSYLRKKMDGQNPDYSIYNKPEVVKTIKKSEFTGSTSIMIGGSETLNKK
jgi:hypothetical protein